MTIALITGGSRGLGHHACLSLADKGVDIIFTYNNNVDAAEETIQKIKSKGVQAYALQLDYSANKNFKKFRTEMETILSKHFQRKDFDYLLNNAGIGSYAPIAEMDEESFDHLYQIHFKGVYFLTQKLLPLIKDGGRILNVSSGLARFSYPGYSAYASMKGAIEVFTRYLAVELGPRKIGVNVIAPGAIETDFGGGAVRDNPDLNQMIANQTPLGRVGLPEDIGEIMAELLAGKTTWINGQRIEASGGIHS